MNDFLKFLDEKLKDFPMHVDIGYSKTCDWTIYIYKKDIRNRKYERPQKRAFVLSSDRETGKRLSSRSRRPNRIRS